MELIQFIHNRIKLSDEAAEKINSAFKLEFHPKDTTLIRPNSFSQKIYFIEKGLLRAYYYKGDKNITQFFFDEDTFTAPLNSVFYNKPEPYGWEVMEDTTVRSIIYRDLVPLIEKYPTFQQFFFQIAIDMLNIFALKLDSIQFQTAEERYKAMMEMYPDLLLRVPLGHIASYLGITQQTLSVIRSKK